MQREDALCRSALHPKFVTEATGIFDREQLLSPVKINEKYYAFSATSRYCAGSDAMVHEHGRRSASIINESFVDRKGIEPDPATVYLGFYEILFGSISELRMKCYSINVRWKPEHGNDAHFQVEFHQSDSGRGAKDRRNDRREAIRKISNGMSGPVLMPVASYDEDELGLIVALEDLGKGRRISD